MERDSNFQMLSWFTDQYRMGNLCLEPPRRRQAVVAGKKVWPQRPLLLWLRQEVQTLLREVKFIFIS